MAKNGKTKQGHHAPAAAHCTNHYSRSVMQLEGVLEERLREVRPSPCPWVQQQPSWSANPCSARLVLTPVRCDMHYMCVPRCAAEPAGAGKCSPEAQGGRPAVRSQQPRWQRVGSNQGGARVVRRRQRGRHHVCRAAPMQPIQLQHPRPQGFPASHAAAGGRRAGKGWSCACSQHVAFGPIGRS